MKKTITTEIKRKIYTRKRASWEVIEANIELLSTFLIVFDNDKKIF